MKKWSKEDWLGVILPPMLVILVGGRIATKDYDTDVSIFIYLAYLAVAAPLAIIIANIISGSDTEEMIIRYALILSAMMFYELLPL